MQMSVIPVVSQSTVVSAAAPAAGKAKVVGKVQKPGPAARSGLVRTIRGHVSTANAELFGHQKRYLEHRIEQTGGGNPLHLIKKAYQK